MQYSMFYKNQEVNRKKKLTNRHGKCRSKVILTANKRMVGYEKRYRSGKKFAKLCKNYVIKLAKPRRNILMQTFLKYYARLDIINVEKIAVMLDEKITREEARRIIIEDNMKEIVTKGSNEIEVFVEDLLNVFKLFVCNNNDTLNLNLFEEQISEAVFLQLLYSFDSKTVHMCKKGLIGSLVLKAAKNVSIWLIKLLNASDLCIAQKYEENRKETYLKCCDPDKNFFIEEKILINSEDLEDDEINLIELRNGILKSNSGLLARATVGLKPIDIHSTPSEKLLEQQYYTKESVLAVLNVPKTSSTDLVSSHILVDTDDPETVADILLLNIPTTSNPPIFVALEDTEKIAELLPIPLLNTPSILLQDPKTSKSIPHLISLRQCSKESSGYDRTTTFPIHVVGEGFNKVFLLSKLNTSCDLEGFCYEFGQRKNLVLYEISNKNLVTNEYHAKRLTDKKIKQYCEKLEIFPDDEDDENEKIQSDLSLDVFKVRKAGEKNFHNIEVKQKNVKNNLKIKLLQPNHE